VNLRRDGQPDRRFGKEKKGDKRFATAPRSVACAKCSAEFTRTAPTQIHCSLKCRLLASVKEMPSGCWEWQKSTVRGYGCMRMQAGPYEYAHRVAYRELVGPIPEYVHPVGPVVMHTCDNRLCCNPAHLRVGTQAENMADMAAKGRAANLGRVMPEEQRRKISETKLAKRRSS
jgi:hypothetical protein